MSKEWLSELKEGDPVVVRVYSWSEIEYIETNVQKITAKGFIRVRDILFYPKNGFARGYSEYMLMNPNDESTNQQKSS